MTKCEFFENVFWIYHEAACAKLEVWIMLFLMDQDSVSRTTRAQKENDYHSGRTKSFTFKLRHNIQKFRPESLLDKDMELLGEHKIG